MNDTILEFDSATFEGGAPYDGAIWQITFQLKATELMLVRLEREHLRLPLADAAQGLVDPIEGSVRFCGKDWRARSPSETAAARAKMGRVFPDPGWVSELDVDENILLALRHHTRRHEAEIRDEAAELARVFSLPGVPQGPSSSVRRQDLRRAACVRAFVAKPVALILENPTAGVYPDIMPALMSSVRSSRSRGSAVLWLTGDPEVWKDPGIRPTSRFIMSGAQMIRLPDE